MKGLAFAAALALCVPPAAADVEGVCGSAECPAGSPHEYEDISCETPACYCWDSCDGSSSSSGDKGAVGRGALLFVAVVITFPFAPLAILEGMQGPNAFGDPAKAKQRWNEHRDRIRELEAHGRAVDKEVGSLRDAVADPARTTPKPRRGAPAYVPVPAAPPRPPENKAQEACSERYRIDASSGNVALAHGAYCACSMNAIVCDPGDWQCDRDALSKYMVCMNAAPPPAGSEAGTGETR